jgi:hypothetical protein
VNQSQNRLLRDVKLCSSHFPPIENKSQYQSCGKMLAASFSMLKLVNQCVIYIYLSDKALLVKTSVPAVIRVPGWTDGQTHIKWYS